MGLCCSKKYYESCDEIEECYLCGDTIFNYMICVYCDNIDFCYVFCSTDCYMDSGITKDKYFI